MSQGFRLVLEAGPLLVFFVANARFGIIPGTGAFMAATTVALLTSWLIERRVPVMPLIGGAFILVFGGLTVTLDDALFIKIKPTVVNALFAGALFVGLMTGRNFLKLAFSMALQLDEEGWRRLAWRWAWFFVALALLNEGVWRTVDTDTWVSFKVFAILPLTLVFSLTQLPLILRHQVSDEPA